MTSSKVRRLTVVPLSGSFGKDHSRRIVVTFVPGKEDHRGDRVVPDLLELRPHGTRRAERIAVVDVYRYALRCRVGRELLERARQAKARKAARVVAQLLARAERKLLKGGREL